MLSESHNLICILHLTSKSHNFLFSSPSRFVQPSARVAPTLTPNSGHLPPGRGRWTTNSHSGGRPGTGGRFCASAGRRFDRVKAKVGAGRKIYYDFNILIFTFSCPAMESTLLLLKPDPTGQTLIQLAALDEAVAFCLQEYSHAKSCHWSLVWPHNVYMGFGIGTTTVLLYTVD
jgi:hypothetical protein